MLRAVNASVAAVKTAIASAPVAPDPISAAGRIGGSVDVGDPDLDPANLVHRGAVRLAAERGGRSPPPRLRMQRDELVAARRKALVDAGRTTVRGGGVMLAAG